MSKQGLCIGKAGEAFACGLLINNGYKILARNYKTKLGEVDIIAEDNDTICFVEVKARTTAKFGLPQEAISRAKQRQIAKAALIFLKQRNLLNRNARFDVVSITCSSFGEHKSDLIKNAFELDPGFTY